MNLIFETVAKGEWSNVPPPMDNPNADPSPNTSLNIEAL